MVHDFEMRVLNQESVQQAEEEAPDNRCLEFPSRDIYGEYEESHNECHGC